jgi:hypothetical protein
METPTHKHDCNECIFLGKFINEDIACKVFGNYDLYYCFQGGKLPTLIARWGEKQRTMSGMIFGKKEQYDMQSPLGEAFRRSKQKGLI